MDDRAWAPQLCTESIACPLPACGARRGEPCRTDRPLHLERWDAWAATGYMGASTMKLRAWAILIALAALAVWWISTAGGCL